MNGGKTSGLAATRTFFFVHAEHQNTASSFSNRFGNWSAAGGHDTASALCCQGPHLEVIEGGGQRGASRMMDAITHQNNQSVAGIRKPSAVSVRPSGRPAGATEAPGIGFTAQNNGAGETVINKRKKKKEPVVAKSSAALQV